MKDFTDDHVLLGVKDKQQSILAVPEMKEVKSLKEAVLYSNALSVSSNNQVEFFVYLDRKKINLIKAYRQLNVAFIPDDSDKAEQVFTLKCRISKTAFKP